MAVFGSERRKERPPNDHWNRFKMMSLLVLPPGVGVDSFAGPVRVEWDGEAALTPLGQLPFFIDFLKTAGLFDAFVADCPLR